MSSSIEVEQTSEVPDGWGFLVRVADEKSRTEHRVTVARADYQRLTGQAVPPGVLLQKTFEFLLEREPKESILRQFDLSMVSRYFPEFDRELRRRLTS
jgi:hypothetical protein